MCAPEKDNNVVLQYIFVCMFACECTFSVTVRSIERASHSFIRYFSLPSYSSRQFIRPNCAHCHLSERVWVCPRRDRVSFTSIYYCKLNINHCFFLSFSFVFVAYFSYLYIGNWCVVIVRERSVVLFLSRTKKIIVVAVYQRLSLFRSTLLLLCTIIAHKHVESRISNTEGVWNLERYPYIILIIMISFCIKCA